MRFWCVTCLSLRGNCPGADAPKIPPISEETCSTVAFGPFDVDSSFTRLSMLGHVG